MRNPIHTVLAAVLAAGLLAAQDPTPPGGATPPKVETKQEPGKQEPGKQEQKPKDAGRQEPKPGDKPATGEEKKPQVTEVDVPKGQPLPASSDPADLQAMRGAQEMLEAEKRIRAQIKAGKIKDIDKLLSFEEVSSWPYEDGLKGIPKSVKELDGQTVVMIGFMLPIDEVENIKEFLLVQSLWACCYGQPPDINGIVRVVMKGDARTDYQFDPIMVRGKFKVEATLEDGYCIDIFQLEADRVSLLK